VTVSIKRAYDDPGPSGQYRVLVDRLWPRGLSKQRARIDTWLKDVAPSPELRTWWNHDPARMADFSVRYRAELDGNPQVAVLNGLIADHADIALLYGARDPRVNHAAVLLDYLHETGSRQPTRAYPES
jgi:uncharacterized protein YeaO (DUF488 family)